MANSRDPAGQPFIGFGDPGVQVIRGPSTGLVAAELSVLIGIPAALFISLCARLSVASRRERLWALSLVGMSPSRSARLFALELGLVALAGVSLGMAVYAATVPILGASGLLGITWWPGQAGLPILPAVFLGLVFVTAVVTVARITILRSAKASRSERQFERRKLLAYLGVVFLCPGAGFLAWLCLAGVVDRNRPPSLSGILPAEIMAAAALAALGLLLLMAPTLEYLARWGTRQISAIGVRLGLQLAGFHVTTTARLVSAVCGIALLGGFSCAFLASMHRDATGDPTAAGVTLDLTVVPAAERARLTRLAKYPHVESVTAVPPGPQGPGIGIIIGSCAELRVAARELFAPEVCRDKPQWGDRGAPEGVTSLPAVPLAQGHTVSIVAPGGGATAGAHWDLKLPPSAAPWALSAKVATLSFVVSSEDGTLDRLLADIHSALPSAVPQAGVKDPDLLAAYYQQTGILRSGLILGFALSLGCFLLTVLDLRWRSRRSLAAQRALGAPKWTLRVSAATQLGFPIALGGIASAIVGTIGGWAFLSYWGTREMFDPAVAAWSFGLAGVSLAVAIVFGLVSGGGKFRLSSLRDI
jgi:hypothetical protein